MICPYCSEWNYMDSNYCRKCGNDLIYDPFRLIKFFVSNKDLFIIFGVFGAFSLYLTTFLNSNQNELIKLDYSIKIGEISFNYMKFGIAGCLLILLLLSIIIIIQAFQAPPERRNIIYYSTGKGSIERVAFIIPFIFFIFGISAYLYSTFTGEIGLILPVFSATLGFCMFLILVREMLKAFGKSLKTFFAISLILTMIVGYAQQIATPLMPSNNLLFNMIFAFNMMFGQGISLLFLLSFLWGVVEILKILKVKIGV